MEDYTRDERTAIRQAIQTLRQLIQLYKRMLAARFNKNAVKDAASALAGADDCPEYDLAGFKQLLRLRIDEVRAFVRSKRDTYDILARTHRYLLGDGSLLAWLCTWERRHGLDAELLELKSEVLALWELRRAGYTFLLVTYGELREAIGNGRKTTAEAFGALTCAGAPALAARAQRYWDGQSAAVAAWEQLAVDLYCPLNDSKTAGLALLTEKHLAVRAGAAPARARAEMLHALDALAGQDIRAVVAAQRRQRTEKYFSEIRAHMAGPSVFNVPADIRLGVKLGNKLG